MSKMAGGLRGAALAAALLGVANGASAQVIVFAPVVTGVPTMSEWMLIVMSLLIAAAAFRAMRSRNIGRPLAWLVSAGLLAGGAASGLHLVGEAEASGVVVVLELNSASGGNVNIPGPGAYSVTNGSGVSQRVTSINTGGFTLGDVFGASPTCEVGLVVPNGNSCFIDVFGGDV